MATFVQLEPPPPPDWDPPTRQVTQRYSATAAVMPWSVDVTGVNPQPDVGWSTPDHGATWSPPAPDNPNANRAQLLAGAAAAVANNVTWLGQAATVTYPLTVAEQTSLVNQVMALTRQVDRVIKVMVGALGDQTGT